LALAIGIIYRNLSFDSGHQIPWLMVRHADTVCRPENVVKEICRCIGWANRNKNHDLEHASGRLSVQYEEKYANRGEGHGTQSCSGHLTVLFVKYGQYNGRDRKITKKAFQGDPDPELKKIARSFGTSSSTTTSGSPRNLTRCKRAFLEQKEKEWVMKQKQYVIAHAVGDCGRMTGTA